jgi:hypothetical protein
MVTGMMLVIVSSHYQVFLCFLQTEIANRFSSFTGDVYVGEVLPGRDVVLILI